MNGPWDFLSSGNTALASSSPHQHNFLLQSVGGNFNSSEQEKSSQVSLDSDQISSQPSEGDTDSEPPRIKNMISYFGQSSLPLNNNSPISTPEKRKRGRPRKQQSNQSLDNKSQNSIPTLTNSWFTQPSIPVDSSFSSQNSDLETVVNPVAMEESVDPIIDPSLSHPDNCQNPSSNNPHFQPNLTDNQPSLVPQDHSQGTDAPLTVDQPTNNNSLEISQTPHLASQTSSLDEIRQDLLKKDAFQLLSFSSDDNSLQQSQPHRKNKRKRKGDDKNSSNSLNQFLSLPDISSQNPANVDIQLPDLQKDESLQQVSVRDEPSYIVSFKIDRSKLVPMEDIKKSEVKNHQQLTQKPLPSTPTKSSLIVSLPLSKSRGTSPLTPNIDTKDQVSPLQASKKPSSLRSFLGLPPPPIDKPSIFTSPPVLTSDTGQVTEGNTCIISPNISKKQSCIIKFKLRKEQCETIASKIVSWNSSLELNKSLQSASSSPIVEQKPTSKPSQANKPIHPFFLQRKPNKGKLLYSYFNYRMIF